MRERAGPPSQPLDVGQAGRRNSIRLPLSPHLSHVSSEAVDSLNYLQVAARMFHENSIFGTREPHNGDWSFSVRILRNESYLLLGSAYFPAMWVWPDSWPGPKGKQSMASLFFEV